MEQFSVGDVVILKSGGPGMTIVEIEDGKAACWWIGYGGSALLATDVSKHEFPLACLAPAPPKLTDQPTNALGETAP